MAEQTYEELKDEVIFQLQQSDKIEISGKIDGDRVGYPLKLDMIGDEQIMFKHPVTIEGEVIDVEKFDPKPNFSILSSDGYRYSFACKIRKKTAEAFAVNFPKNIDKDSMRQDVRVDVNIPIQYWIDPDQELLFYAPDKGKKFTANVTNISAGGGFLVTKDKIFFKNFFVKLHFTDKDLKFLGTTTARIVRVKSLRTPQTYGLAFMFSDVGGKDKERLIRWIFQVQLEQQQRQKEFGR
ncbi:MAG: hypothetical protein CVV64_14760 [Candidatus Wallbacteria bacterium HGW-Wallbacteria-1]|jgi:c-di-GMP-binding flagellar brake protein YcgR|uniref:PilZ domain-containing protein n=1 Tax=Candidatus Wallbacteria bacterium HGW-Wallbacteria-1 TaxID=2013854 RepID=A0A2N1PM16_9BACT|nr:MAG: hypothetical protein CVV64_14760 [Candidatus Wallbacteria bacterium HGW-Wallbacteria-1]